MPCKNTLQNANVIEKELNLVTMRLDNVHANLELKELYVTDASPITLILVILTDVKCATAGKREKSYLNPRIKVKQYLF